MNICKTCLSRFGCHPSFETDGVEICSFYKADKNAVPKQIDWEQRRYEIAKDVVVSLLQRSNSTMCTSVDDAMRITDELIMRLKENKLC